MFFFMNPLSKEVWICIIVSYIVVGIVLFLVNRLSVHEYYAENVNRLIPRYEFSVYNALLFWFGGNMRHSVSHSMSGRPKEILTLRFFLGRLNIH